MITSQRKADAENYGFDELMEHGQRYESFLLLGRKTAIGC